MELQRPFPNYNVNSDTERSRLDKPMTLSGHLEPYRSFKVTPVIGTEFPDANVAEWMRAEQSDELLRDLAVTDKYISHRGVVFFRAQTDLTNELQKELADRLGRLTGKPESSTLHVHPLQNFNPEEDKHINTITTDQAANPAENLWKNRPSDIRNSWYTDAGYEPNPPDYSILKVVKLPETGGDTMWSSSCEIYDKISPSYRAFLEGLTAKFSQIRLPRVAAEKGFELYTEPRGSPNNIGASLTTVHPVVRTNPVTVWKSLFAVGNHVESINDVTPDESKRLLDWFLQLIVEEHDSQLRHRWQSPYDLAIWDDRTVYHTAIFDYAGLGSRTGYRAVGIGERPFFDPGNVNADSNDTVPAEVHTQDVFLFALNRTCSHVLCRLLSDQPGWIQSNYHFKRAFDFARESFNWNPIASVSDDRRRGFEKLLQEGFEEIQIERQSAIAENKSMFLKEHTFYIWEPSRLSQSMWGGPPSPAFTVQDEWTSSVAAAAKTNPTIFPDTWLLQWRPLFLIRHPALTFESWYRAESGARHIDLADRSWAFYTTYQYSRQLYDWFLSSGLKTSKPIVIDADDILENGPAIKDLCLSIGMDENKILYEWDTIQAPENAGRRELKFMSEYWSSTSVGNSKSSRGIDLQAVYGRWEKDFGASAASELHRIVERSMVDYNYLRYNKI